MYNETKFELTAADIAYIEEDYEFDKILIEYVAEKINNSNIVKTEEDFKDLVCDCVSEIWYGCKTEILDALIQYKLGKYSHDMGYSK